MSVANTEQPKGKRNFRSSLKKGILALVLFIVVAAAGVIGTDTGKYFTKKYLPAGNGDVKISEMRRYNVGTTALSILSPGVLKDRPFPLPDNFKDKVISFHNYEYREGPIIAIACTEVKYVTEIMASAEGAANNILNSISNLDSVSDFKRNKKPIIHSGLKGISFSAEYNQNSALLKAKGVVLTINNQMWQVSILYPGIMKESNLLADQILSSIRIEGR